MSSDKSLRDFVSRVVGASAAFGERVSVYIPNKGRALEDGKPQVEIADWKGWVRRGMDILGQINGGATASGPANGYYLDKEKANEQVWESTFIVYSFIERDAFRSRVLEFRHFLHAFGRETRQGAVFFEFDGYAFQIEPPFDRAD